jgi:hypothetical protein
MEKVQRQCCTGRPRSAGRQIGGTMDQKSRCAPRVWRAERSHHHEAEGNTGGAVPPGVDGGGGRVAGKLHELLPAGGPAMLQAAMEVEAGAFIGRASYQRRQQDQALYRPHRFAGTIATTRIVYAGKRFRRLESDLLFPRFARVRDCGYAVVECQREIRGGPGSVTV